MEPGVRVWVRDPDGLSAWLPGVVQSKLALGGVAEGGLQDVQVELEDEDHLGDTMSFPCMMGHTEADDIKLRNREEDDMAEDLIDLPFLHEPAILHTLGVRFKNGLIYTFTGPILIAVNPFQRLPLYTDQILQTYYSAGLMRAQGMADLTEKMTPHVYAIADNAYRDMMTVVQKRGKDPRMKQNQAVLISGESGAGKTESTKIVMRYLTAVGNTTGRTDFDQGSVMDRVLQSNPILEAFGNARTNRNDNSSRFGKYIELLFNRRGNLVGAAIETYLLEKVRLASQLTGERNFHVFYQITCADNDEVLSRFGVSRDELALGPPQGYNYINQGGIYKLRGVNDVDELADLQHAMEVLRFSAEEQGDIVRLVSGLLHLGQISFRPTTSTGGDGSDLNDTEEAQSSMQRACALLGVEQDTLISALTKRTIQASGETYQTLLTVEQAMDACAATVKAIYLNLFEYIVSRVNENIKSEEEWRSSIGVLDIFGFECFERNTFEQLCINYTNETLQQHFNSYVFKLEQKEYEREGIEWSFIEFPDNQDCLDLIEARPHGLFATLDDECRMGQRGNDRNFVNRLYKQYVPNRNDTHPRFGADVNQKRDYQFSIKHYAGNVVYDSDGFLNKNKDELPPEATAVFVSSTRALMRDSHEMYQSNATARANAASAGTAKKSRSMKVRAPTVSNQFKNQLHSLMDKVNGCAPHYIRCIKPNDLHSADIFAKMRTVDQLRYGGVLEAVRVARSGFPVRLPHLDFYTQYRCLLNAAQASAMPIATDEGNNDATRKLCKQVVDNVYDEMHEEIIAHEIRVRQSEATGSDDVFKEHRLSNARGIGSLLGNMPTFLFDREEVQLGNTKIFMRKGAYEILEAARTRRLGAWARRIQSCYRRWKLRRNFQAMRLIAKHTQRLYRGAKARSMVWQMRVEKSALVLKTFLRGATQRLKFLRVRYMVLYLQSKFRAQKARMAYLKKMCESKAVTIQRTWRGHRARRGQKTTRRAIVSLQCCVRRMVAKRKLRDARVEAKSVGKLQQNNDDLKREIDELRAAAMEATAIRKDKEAAENAAGVVTLRDELDAVLVELEELRSRAETAERDRDEFYEEYEFLREELAGVSVLYRDEQVKNMQLQRDYEDAVESADNAARASQYTFNDAPRARSTSVFATANRARTFSAEGDDEPKAPAKSHSRKSSRDSNGAMPYPLVSRKSLLEEDPEDDLEFMREELDGLSTLYRSERVKNMQLQRDYESAVEAAERSARAAQYAERSLAETKRRMAKGMPAVTAGNRPRTFSTDEGSVKSVASNSAGNVVASPKNGGTPRSRRNSRTAALGTTLPQSIMEGVEPEEKPKRLTPVNSGETDKGAHRRSSSAIKESRRRKSAAGAQLPVDYKSVPRPEATDKRPSLLSMIAHKLNMAQQEGAWEDADVSDGASDIGMGLQSGDDSDEDDDGFEPVGRDTFGDGAIELDQEDSGARMRRLYSYESHLQEFQLRLRKGIEVRVWDEGAGRQGVLCSMMLKEEGGVARLSWEHSITWRRTLFGQRTAIPDLPFFELEHIWTGHSELYGLEKKDESRYITIVASPTPTTQARSVVIMCYNRTQRNGLLQGLRKLIADIEVLGGGKGGKGLPGGLPGGLPSPTAGPADTSLSTMLFGGQGAPGAPGGSWRGSPAPPATPDKGRARQSIAEVARGAQERAAQHSDSITTHGGNFQRFSANESKEALAQLAGSSGDSAPEEIMVKLSDVQRTITAERLNYEKLMIQMLENQNDLNDKEDEIGQLKRSMEDMRALLVSRDEAIRNDSQVRMRLGKRIEDLENDQSILQEDNEKLILEVHELRKMKTQLDQYKAQLAKIVV